MKKLTMWAYASLALLLAVTSQAGSITKMHEGLNGLHCSPDSTRGGNTIILMGPGGQYQGDFEDAKKAIGLPWEWNSVDVSNISSHWQVSNHNNNKPGMSGGTAWCGLDYPACTLDDDPWGYGEDWVDWLDFVYTVPDPNVSSTVTMTYNIFWDSEIGYDYTHLFKITEDLDPIAGHSYDGTGSEVGATFSTTYFPEEYVNGTDIVIRFAFISDFGWDDNDCFYPTSGAVNLDDITVAISNPAGPPFVTFTDFNTKDLLFGAWQTTYPPAVGDFAAVWPGLQDYDPCVTNYTKVLAFLDDGSVTGADPYACCWCYGPNGYVVHPQGGIAGPAFHIDNYVETPVMTWPNPLYDGITFAFDNYTHETIYGDSPGIFSIWGVRSATDQQDITMQPYRDRSFVYYGTPAWEHRQFPVSDLMEQGRTSVQFRVGVIELGYVWGYEGLCSDPAPYFDNLEVKVYPVVGPGMAAREIELANDAFHEIGVFDAADLSQNRVRFDMAMNISPPDHLRNDAGDSIVVEISPLRAGAVLASPPELHWTVLRNPLFDAYRTAMPVGGGTSSGVVFGWNPVVKGVPITDRFAFDLPDSGFLFPGDIMHYYIEATDIVGMDAQTATLPTDLTGFGDFSKSLTYNSAFVVHALPTVWGNGSGGFEQPPVLFWDDFGDRRAEAKWHYSLNRLKLTLGLDFDIYRTNGPSSGVGNGLGGRTGHLGIQDYRVIIHSSGDLCHYTLSNGNFLQDPSQDIQVLTNWLDLGSKFLFLGGDSVASELADPGNPQGNAFLTNYMGVSYVDDEVAPLISNQIFPLINEDPSGPIRFKAKPWGASGGCPDINRIDAVTALSSASRCAYFEDLNGLDTYPYSACTLNMFGSPLSIVISLPYDWANVQIWKKDAAPMEARTQLLMDILEYFGLEITPEEVVNVPENVRFATRTYPNPFNPVTKIEYTVPRAGELTLKIFNVRGELVRTLIDGLVEQSGHIMWDGTSDKGSPVSSGVYFSEARFGGEISIQKMALVK